MTDLDLATDGDLDFAGLQLTYEKFRLLATNAKLSPHGRIGFPDTYRHDFEADIFADIRAKLPALAGRHRTVLEIGPGCANLPRMLIELCADAHHSLYLVDSPEMLAQLPDAAGVHKIPGAFPACLATGTPPLAPASVDALLCYSVLQYLFVETNPFQIVDLVVTLLAPRGAALFGDIPNHSKRTRFFASAAGRDYHERFKDAAGAPHQRFTSNATPEPARFPQPHGRIDDGVLLAMMQRAQAAGCDAYLVPQPDTLPMANRRDDLIIRKP